jgi:hypothetical protein
MVKYCFSCGKPLQIDDAEICPSCGARFKKTPSQNSDSSVSRSTIYASIYIFIGFILLCVSVVMKGDERWIIAIFSLAFFVGSYLWIKSRSIKIWMDGHRFNNCQENSLDGSSNRFNNFFFQAYLVIFFVPAAFLLLLPIMYITLAFMNILTISNVKLRSINFFDSLLNPILIIFITLTISAICIYRPMQRMGTIQNHNQSRKKFKFTRFFSVIIIGFIILIGFSMIFDMMSSNANPNKGCDICGGPANYEYTVNDEGIHQYCDYHAMGWAFSHPITVMVDPPTHGYGFENQFSVDDIKILLSALLGILTWVFIIGFAFILGSGYTWEKNGERKILKSIEIKIKKLYLDIKLSIRKFFEIYRNN